MEGGDKGLSIKEKVFFLYISNKGLGALSTKKKFTLAPKSCFTCKTLKILNLFGSFLQGVT